MMTELEKLNLVRSGGGDGWERGDEAVFVESDSIFVQNSA